MKLSIKNARRLECALDDQARRLVDKLNDRVSYGTIESSLTGTKDLIESVLEKLHTIKGIRKDVRDAIGLFNARTSINQYTADIAYTTSELEVATLISEMNSPRADRSYGSDKPTYSGGVSEETREQYYVETLKLKRVLQRLKDKCQGINSSGTIELSDCQEVFLKKSGLMD